MTYTRNTVRGQWAAHGRYLDREKARASGFNERGEPADTAQLAEWQRAGDPQIWRLIISPEFGERIDLQRLTNELMHRVEADRGGARLEWVAVVHHNTEHPHVHVALRGLDGVGEPVRFEKDFIKHGLRELAGNLCTQQLGYRSEFDTSAAQRREVNQRRFTSLDRSINRSNTQEKDPGGSGSFTVRPQHQQVAQRLIVLQGMGLAKPVGRDDWSVRRDFEAILRSMQRLIDRQRTLAGHGMPVSDERLPIETIAGREWKVLDGRVLVHGLDEDGPDGGCGYLMLESTSGRIHHVPYTPELEEARHQGQLRTNHFVRLRRYIVSGNPVVEAEDLGDADAILRNHRHLHEAARELLKQGPATEEAGWGGWLGQYHAAVRQAALKIEQLRAQEQVRTHGRGDSRGR